MAILAPLLVAQPDASARGAQQLTCLGRVFHDDNVDGTLQPDNGEELATQVTVLIAGAFGSTTELLTDPSGRWQLPAGFNFPIRVEVVPPEGHAIGPAGPDAGTRVQYIDQATECELSNVASAGIYTPGELCTNNPSLTTSCFVVFDVPHHDESTAILTLEDRVTDNGTGDGLTASDWLSPVYTSVVTAGEVGSVYGIDVADDGTIYAASFVKEATRTRSSLNPDGNPTAVFVVPPGGPAELLTMVDDDAVDPHGTEADRVSVIDQVFAAGLGDIQLVEGGTRLWVTDMGRRELAAIDVASGSVESRVALDGAALGIDSCQVTDDDAFGDLRPFGLGLDLDGDLLVGLVCSGESSVRDADFPVDGPAPGDPAGDDGELMGYVYEFDGATFSQRLTWPLVGDRGRMQQNGRVSHDAAWHPWVPFYPFNEEFDAVAYSQPAVSDLSVGPDGVLVIALADRWGHQTAPLKSIPSWDGSTRMIAESLAGGDLQRACPVDAGWVIEGSDGCAGGLYSNEFFHDDRYGVHDETGIGSVVHLPGRDEVVATHMDPIPGDDTWRSGGLRWHRLTDGTVRKGVRIYDGRNAEPDATFEKAAGIGGIALGCGLTPVQIGSMVWYDHNQNGTRELDEPGIANVELGIYSPFADRLATTTTDERGQFLFDWRNVEGLTPNVDYQVVVEAVNFERGGVFHRTGEWRGLIGHSAVEPTHRDNSASLTAIATDDRGFILPASTATVGDDPATATIEGSVTHEVAFGMIDSLDLAIDAAITAIDLGVDTAAFEATVSNGGSLSSGPFEVRAQLPDGVTFQTSSRSPIAGPDEPTVRWRFGAGEALAPGESRSIAFTASVIANPTSRFAIDLEVVPEEPDNDPSNNEDVIRFGIGELGGVIEPARSGVTMTLIDSVGDEVATTTSDEAGRYVFSFLAPGKYQVEMSGAVFGEDRIFSAASRVSAPGLSDADPATDRLVTAEILLAGDSPLDEDFESPSGTLDSASDLTIDFSVTTDSDTTRYWNWRLLVPGVVFGLLLLWLLVRRRRKRR